MSVLGNYSNSYSLPQAVIALILLVVIIILILTALPQLSRQISKNNGHNIAAYAFALSLLPVWGLVMEGPRILAHYQLEHNGVETVAHIDSLKFFKGGITSKELGHYPTTSDISTNPFSSKGSENKYGIANIEFNTKNGKIKTSLRLTVSGYNEQYFRDDYGIDASDNMKIRYLPTDPILAAEVGQFSPGSFDLIYELMGLGR